MKVGRVNEGNGKTVRTEEEKRERCERKTERKLKNKGLRHESSRPLNFNKLFTTSIINFSIT
jgi:hypothetical protein